MNRSLLNQKYVPLRQLAEGSMGEIFLARQTGIAGFQREVVLKRIHRRLNDNARAVSMFLDEARLAAALSHPNIVQIYDVGEEDGAYFIVMERIQGTDLRHLAEATTRQGQRIPMELSVQIIAQVLEGLRYAHTFRDESGRPLRIVHRDIGPNNILVSHDGAVKIIDFGIARAEEQLHSEGSMRRGKLAYMSPEMVKGEPVDARADLFSVGVLLYELTVGQRLFRAASFADLRRVVDDPIPPPTFARAGYPVDLEILVMRALERDPTDRFESAEVMLEELEQFAFSTGLRLSRLRLGRFVCKVMGHSASRELEAEPPPATMEQPVEPVTDDLDFDRQGIFEGEPASAADAADAVTRVADTAVGQERVRRVMEAVQQANEAIADLVAATEADEPAGGSELGHTMEMRVGMQEALRARSAEPEVPERDGSALIVTDELVEEELDLGDPGEDLIRERPLLGDDPDRDLAVPPEPPRERSEVSVPAEPSADLMAALADIRAELGAAHESDRRREAALAQVIEHLEDQTEVPPPTTTSVSASAASSAAPGAIPPAAPPPPPASVPPVSPTEQQPAAAIPVPLPSVLLPPSGPLSEITAVEDELERTDGRAWRAPDELELSDVPLPGAGGAAGRRALAEEHELELEADGETIILREDESVVEVIADEDSSSLRLEPPRPEPPRPPPSPPLAAQPARVATPIESPRAATLRGSSAPPVAGERAAGAASDNAGAASDNAGAASDNAIALTLGAPLAASPAIRETEPPPFVTAVTPMASAAAVERPVVLPAPAFAAAPSPASLPASSTAASAAVAGAAADPPPPAGAASTPSGADEGDDDDEGPTVVDAGRLAASAEAGGEAKRGRGVKRRRGKRWPR